MKNCSGQSSSHMHRDGLTNTAILLRISQESERARRAGNIYLQSDCNTVLPYLREFGILRQETLIKSQFMGKI